MESYRQTLRITFVSPEAARRACLVVTPLYRGFRAAFSTRMDDTNAGALGVAEVMARHGQKGTFYLNRTDAWWEDNVDARGAVRSVEPGVDIPRQLLAAGHSIGGHTSNHDYLPALSKNGAFREILANRIALETQTGRPVVSFTFPFVSFRSDVREGADHADLEQILIRAGFYQLAEHDYRRRWRSELQDGWFIACDGSDAAPFTDARLAELPPEAHGTLFLVTMHPWARAWGGPDFPKLAAIYRKWSNRADLWYCHHNEYAAYRHQFRETRLSQFVDGSVIEVELTRPDPVDLGDWIPLTLMIEGASGADVKSVACPGAETHIVEAAGAPVVDVHHDRDRGPIESIRETTNAQNRAGLDDAEPAAEGLRARLHRREDSLRLTLHNAGDRELEDIRVTFRVPLRWADGVQVKRLARLAAGKTETLDVALRERADPEHYRDGAEYHVAQIDFRGGQRVRLFATCETPAAAPSACFARDGFWVLGPLPSAGPVLDPQVFSPSFVAAPPPGRLHTVPWGKSLHWFHLPGNAADFLDPDIIPTTARAEAVAFWQWHSSDHFPYTPISFVLAGRIVSPAACTVRAVFSRGGVKALRLNDRAVDGDRLDLAKGENDIRILYEPPMLSEAQFSERNYGCYFRLVDLDGRRVTDVRFERPPRPGSHDR